MVIVLVPTFLVINGDVICLSDENKAPASAPQDFVDRFFSLSLLKQPVACTKNHYLELTYLPFWVERRGNVCPGGGDHKIVSTETDTPLNAQYSFEIDKELQWNINEFRKEKLARERQDQRIETLEKDDQEQAQRIHIQAQRIETLEKDKLEQAQRIHIQAQRIETLEKDKLEQAQRIETLEKDHSKLKEQVNGIFKDVDLHAVGIGLVVSTIAIGGRDAFKLLSRLAVDPSKAQIIRNMGEWIPAISLLAGIASATYRFYQGYRTGKIDNYVKGGCEIASGVAIFRIPVYGTAISLVIRLGEGMHDFYPAYNQWSNACKACETQTSTQTSPDIDIPISSIAIETTLQDACKTLGVKPTSSQEEVDRAFQELCHNPCNDLDEASQNYQLNIFKGMLNLIYKTNGWTNNEVSV